MTGRANITIARHKKSPTGFRLVHLYLTLAYSKGQSQGHAYFESDLRQIWQTLLLQSNMKSDMGIRLAYFILTLADSTGHYQGRAHFRYEYVEDGDRSDDFQASYGLSMGIVRSHLTMP